MTIVEPCSNGLGSDAFCILWDGKAARAQRVGPGAGGVDAGVLRAQARRRGAAPPMRGWDSVTVPGAVAGGWRCRSASASCRSPTCSRPRSRSPSAATRCRSWSSRSGPRRRRCCRDQPGWAEAFLPQGRAPEVGERFAFPAAARALSAIAATRGAAFYGGEIAAAAAAHARANGGAMTARTSPPSSPNGSSRSASTRYGHRLHEIPPNGQGIAALIALGILRHFDIASMPVDGVDRSTCRSRR